ncbi:MAG: riboflavin synthase, partial [Halobacteria archaeon]|nr:riboflavin synthase [Halobacteria archaeon]
MFTGIVEETGVVQQVEKTEDGVRLRIEASTIDDYYKGQSISVSGVCLTVEEFEGTEFEVFLSDETVEKTYLGNVDEGHVVNLERALRADERLDGHFVQGHVDGVTHVSDIEQVGEDWVYEFDIPEAHTQYVVSKGSVSLDGISLTVAELRNDTFTVAI